MSDHHMLISYSYTGQNKDRVCISLFEVDMDTMAISPSNFLIITQQVDKEATRRDTPALDENLMTLSAVAEEPLEQESGSFS